MILTDGAWLPAQAALDYLTVAAGSPQAAVVEQCRKAAAVTVEKLRQDRASYTVDSDGDGVNDSSPTFAADDGLVQGGLLLTARLYARKGSPVGVATFGELGAASIVRTDPDVQLLLGLGRHATPRVG